MASNNEYKRYFIILQEDDKGYEMSPGKIPTGYVKIEVKNSKVRLNAFIQNVRSEDRIEYRLILVASGKKLAVDVGKIIIDGSGRGELSYELESDNVLKSGLHIADFTVAAVASGASVPLSGYTGRDKLEWKGRYEVVNRQKAVETPRIDKKIKIEEILPEIPKPITPPQPGVPLQPIMEPEGLVMEQPVPKPEAMIEEMPAPKPEVVIEEAPAPKPEVKIEEVPAPKPEVMIEEVPAPKPEVVIEEVPVEIPEPIIVIQQPVEHTHIHESNVEVKIVMPQCPPMAPIEEPCEIQKEKIKYEDIKQYYYEDEEDESDRDSDDDSDRDSDDDSDDKKHHEEKGKYGHKVSPYYSSNMYSKMKRVLRGLRRYEPFEDERDHNWFKVGEDIYEVNSVAIPYMGYMVPMGYPFMSEGCSMMMDRKDYILGVKYEDKDDDDDRRLIRHLLFGVPAIYSKRNEQYFKSRGFMEYKHHKSKGYGYFVMCLDLRSGMLCHME